MAESKKIGEWTFLVGVLVAVLVGLFSAALSSIEGWLVLLLVVAGLVVGFLNVSEKESTAFLVAAAALLITGTTGETLTKVPFIGVYLASVVKQIAVFVTPAAIVVALKAIAALAKD